MNLDYKLKRTVMDAVIVNLMKNSFKSPSRIARNILSIGCRISHGRISNKEKTKKLVDLQELVKLGEEDTVKEWVHFNFKL